MIKPFGSPTKKERQLVIACVDKFAPEVRTFEGVAEALHVQLLACKELRPLIHSSKWRVKDPEHLRDKLFRKIHEANEAGKPFSITVDNLFEKIPDLAGIRLLHLHTNQMSKIHPLIMKVLEDNLYDLVEDATAHTWDDEYRKYFTSISIAAKPRDSMYTSVHYVVALKNKLKLRCELQVRSLMEEVWGEVSHTLNYPHETKSIACKEQLKVLARLASSGTRLVDSIFKSFDEHNG